MGHFLDLETWPRRETFDFFRTFQQPFFDVVVPLDITKLYAWVKVQEVSFFQASLYLSIRAANQTEPFRYRLRGERVWVHEQIDAGSTVLRPDETFGFAYLAYKPNFPAFLEAATPQLTAVKNGRHLEPAEDRDDLIHYSVLPWLAFTAFRHARKPVAGDSTPKMVFGKHQIQGQRRVMPLSISVHHALMDGLHVGRFVARLEKLLDRPQDSLV